MRRPIRSPGNALDSDSVAAQRKTQIAPPLYVGTSGWAYASWKPGFYPSDVSAKRFLEHYASRLNTVEVNYTFSKLPTSAMVEAWLAATPQNFRFTFKAPQGITHYKRLKECGELVAGFLASIRAVDEAGRMGAVLFQLPPNFKVDIARLERFFAEADLLGHRVSFEFRHPSWFVEDVFAGLRMNNAALCIAECDELETPDVQTASFGYYRLRKSAYSGAAIKQIASSLAAGAAERETYAYFKHEDAPDGPLRAEAVLAQAAKGTRGGQ